MKSFQGVLNRHLAVLWLPSLLCLFLLAACGSPAGGQGVYTPGNPVSTAGTSSVAYTQGAGQVLIRLIDAPGNIFPSLRAVPTWELYGDGTLLYQPQSASADTTLLQAQLSPAEVAHILNVVVDQDGFFADQKSLYGRGVADGGEQVLTVNTTQRQKTVSLFVSDGVAADQHMFSILNFLQTYRPTSAHPYAAPGAVVLVRSYGTATAAGATAWPYPDISLAQIATQECQISVQGCAANSPGGYFPIYGQRGTDLLNQFKSSQSGRLTQGGQTYLVLAWPLLPDNLVVQTDGKHWVQTAGMNGGRWPLLAGTH